MKGQYDADLRELPDTEAYEVAHHPQWTPTSLMPPVLPPDHVPLYDSPLKTGVMTVGTPGPAVPAPQGLGLTTDPVARKKLQMWTFLMEYFPDTFLAVLDVAIKGNDQHNPGQPLHWAKEKSTDQMNTAFRHMWDHGRGVHTDTDGCYHLAKSIWRQSAELQLLIAARRARGEVK